MPGKFKDESASKCITEFVGLRSKMYSFMLDDKKDVSKVEVRVAKDVQKSVIFNDLRFSTNLNWLWNNEVKVHNFKTICSMKHSVATYAQSKITLCPFEDKRYLLDAINSLPYDHYALVFELFSFLIWVIIRKNIPSFPQTMNRRVISMSQNTTTLSISNHLA